MRLGKAVFLGLVWWAFGAAQIMFLEPISLQFKWCELTFVPFSTFQVDLDRDRSVTTVSFGKLYIRALETNIQLELTLSITDYHCSCIEDTRIRAMCELFWSPRQGWCGELTNDIRIYTVPVVEEKEPSPELCSTNSCLKAIKYREKGCVNLCGSNFEYLDTSRSSWICGAWYDATYQYMVICLKGVYYHYCDVPREVWEQFKQCESFGSCYNLLFRGQYSCIDKDVPSYPIYIPIRYTIWLSVKNKIYVGFHVYGTSPFDNTKIMVISLAVEWEKLMSFLINEATK